MTTQQRSRTARKHSQSGQAMVYLAIVLVVLVGVLYSTFDLARLTMAKIQSQNAADAAALAAVSVKVSVHNTRTLAYAAMTAEATLARLHLAKAFALLGENNVIPGQPFAALPQFTQEISQAADHEKKLADLRQALIAYNHWVAQAGPQIVGDAARIGYAANIGGMNANLGTGAALNQQNLHLLDGSPNLVENGANLKSGEFIGGTNYRAESAGKDGDAGKTFVWVEPQYVPLGFGWLGAGRPLAIPALAAAGPVSATQIGKSDPQSGALSISGLGVSLGLPWYSPRLFPIGNLHGYPNAILH